MLALSLQLILLIHATTDYTDWDATFYLFIYLLRTYHFIPLGSFPNIALLSFLYYVLFDSIITIPPCIGSTVIFSLFTASFSLIGLACHHK